MLKQVGGRPEGQRLQTLKFPSIEYGTVLDGMTIKIRRVSKQLKCAHMPERGEMNGTVKSEWDLISLRIASMSTVSLKCNRVLLNTNPLNIGSMGSDSSEGMYSITNSSL